MGFNHCNCSQVKGKEGKGAAARERGPATKSMPPAAGDESDDGDSLFSSAANESRRGRPWLLFA